MNETIKPKQGKSIRVDYFYNNDKSLIKYDKQDLMRILQNEINYESPIVHNPAKYLYVTDHATDRWIERVNRTITTQRELEVYLNESASLGRIHYLKNDFAILNYDIIFHYFKDGDNYVVSSFYGSIKEMPALANIDLLPQYINTKTDGLHLEVCEERILRSKVWPLPIFDIRYMGSKGPYMFEIYEAADGEKVCFYVCKNGVRRYWILGDPQVNLSKSTITAIKIFNGTHGFAI